MHSQPVKRSLPWRNWAPVHLRLHQRGTFSVPCVSHTLYHSHPYETQVALLIPTLQVRMTVRGIAGSYGLGNEIRFQSATTWQLTLCPQNAQQHTLKNGITPQKRQKVNLPNQAAACPVARDEAGFRSGLVFKFWRRSSFCLQWISMGYVNTKRRPKMTKCSTNFWNLTTHLT